MPLFEYTCGKCGKEFEELVRDPDDAVACPHCGSKKTEKRLSAFAARVGGSAASGGASACPTGTCPYSP